MHWLNFILKQNTLFYTSYFSMWVNIIRAKSEILFTHYINHTNNIKNTWKTSFGRPRRRWEDNIKVNVWERGGRCIELTQNLFLWQVLCWTLGFSFHNGSLFRKSLTFKKIHNYLRRVRGNKFNLKLSLYVTSQFHLATPCISPFGYCMYLATKIGMLIIEAMGKWRYFQTCSF
jgi:hypothetical protein